MLASFTRYVLDFFYPPRCPSCRGAVDADGNFCATCFQQLRLISAPLCGCCGIPFAVAVEDDMRCPTCLESPPSYDRARAAIVYDAISAPLVSALKFNDQWAGVERHVRMMHAVGNALLAEADMLIPVPLHWRRLLQRRFNQSAVLAFGLARLTALPCCPEMLQRVQHTTPQMKLTRKQRLTNVAKAFAVHDDSARDVAGKRIVLVDDVMTTGATAEACARTLKKAGAARVDVLTLARTTRE